MGGVDILMLGALVLAAFAAYNLTFTLFRTNSEQDALRWATGDEPIRSKSPIINFSRPLVHNFTLQHAARIKNEGYRRKILMRIKTAGLEGELNVDEYIGLQILWGLLFPLILFILNFALNLGWPPPVMFVFGLFGFAFPNFYAGAEKKRRYTSVVADLPFFLDLLTLSVAAGLDLMGAMQRIVEKAERSVLAKEFDAVLKDIRLGRSRDDALREMAERLDTAEITSFVAVVVDAYASGTPIGKVLRDQSEQLRLERFVRAEKAGAKASQMILIPLMMFILPAVMVVVFGPVVIQFVYGGTGQ
ncbi:MAG: type II secretion system F family protein [Pseudomonadota bacterium]|nr:type II secretion system F family protein [Pseudomonadota bacterium]